MAGLEVLALALGVVNGFILVIRPAARFHSRLDVLEAKLEHVAEMVDRLERRSEGL